MKEFAHLLVPKQYRSTCAGYKGWIMLVKQVIFMDYSKRQTALDHEILMSIDKPSRYTGGEPGSVMKDSADIRFVI